MAINFPSSPSAGTIYTFGGRTWKYNSQSAWERLPATDFVTLLA